MDRKAEPAEPTPWVRTVLIGRNPGFTLVRIVVLVITCFVVSKFVLRPIRIEGISMFPTYKDRHINFINRLAYWSHEPQRGDVVGIRPGPGESIMYLKRIVGLPGEEIAFHHGHVVVNGQLLPEPYLVERSDWEIPAVKVGPDEYFVVGDNRSMNKADHTFGRAHRERIVGRILL
jgi:signal peptidase I